MIMDYLGEIALILILIVLLIIIVPLLCSMGFALLVGATGEVYYFIVILVALLLWGLMGIYYYN